MTAHAPVTMTKEAFLAWAERREERYEYAGGRVIMMVHVSRNHAVVASNIVAALKARLMADHYDVVAAEFAVHIGDSIRFPDVLVQRAQTNGKALASEEPIMIAEVLSPGSLHLDFGDKPREYLTLPSLDTYLVIAPDEPRVWIWQRREGAFPAEPEMVEGAHITLPLPALAIEIPLTEIYRGVR
jgi:Uma2 family endonuclease